MAAQHYSDIEDALRRVGFRHDISQGAPICRWLLDNMIIDIMPTEGMLIGLNTQWFAEALASSTYKCINGVQVPIISPVSFIATKLAAFADRGREDYYGSHDLEDIVAVIDGRAEIVAEIDKDVEALKRYVVNGIQSLWRSNEFQESLAGHLPPDSASQARLPGLRKKLRAIVALE